MNTKEIIKKYLEHGLCVDVAQGDGYYTLYPNNLSGYLSVDKVLKKTDKFIKAYHYKDYKPYEVGQRVEFGEHKGSVINSKPDGFYEITGIDEWLHHSELIPEFEEEKEEKKPFFDKLKKVIDAYKIAGPRPDIHEKEKRNLKKNWPALYKALEELTE